MRGWVGVMGWGKRDWGRVGWDTGWGGQKGRAGVWMRGWDRVGQEGRVGRDWGTGWGVWGRQEGMDEGLG